MDKDTLRRIMALKAMTLDAGCTEAEAMAAAEKAAELMARYQLTESDLTMTQAAIASKTAGKSMRDPLWNVLSWCTNTAAIIDRRRDGMERIFFGRAPGPEVATYLYVVLDRAIDRAIKDFKAGPVYKRRRTTKTRKQAVADFTGGLVDRLSVRLRALFGPQVSKEASRQAIAARDAQHPDAANVAGPPSRPGRFFEAEDAGHAAAGRIHLAHGVAGSGPVGQIGGRR